MDIFCKEEKEIQLIHNLKYTNFKPRILHLGTNFCVHLDVHKTIMRLLFNALNKMVYCTSLLTHTWLSKEIVFFTTASNTFY